MSDNTVSIPMSKATALKIRDGVYDRQVQSELERAAKEALGGPKEKISASFEGMTVSEINSLEESELNSRLDELMDKFGISEHPTLKGGTA